jgi:hypothetical protein
MKVSKTLLVRLCSWHNKIFTDTSPSSLLAPKVNCTTHAKLLVALKFYYIALYKEEKEFL